MWQQIKNWLAAMTAGPAAPVASGRLPAYPNQRAALYGALVGDALGVPFEFKRPSELPTPAFIEMIVRPPQGQFPGMPSPTWRRSHQGTPEGTWSDDGAQMLALLDTLNAGPFDPQAFAQRLLQWHDDGAFTPDGRVFDIGLQTGAALDRIRQGVPALMCGGTGAYDNGNGSLMRVLPVAWKTASPSEAFTLARTQSLVTHGHVLSQMCCAFYAMLVQAVLAQGADPATANAEPAQRLKRALDLAAAQLEELAAPSEQHGVKQVLGHVREPRGSGFVLDTLWGAIKCVQASSNYEGAVKRAIRLGNDTDTTACVAGGLAGALYGMEAIPERWLAELKGKPMVDAALDGRAIHRG